MFNRKIVTTTMIALSLSMGLSACIPAQGDKDAPTASPEASVSATASAEASPYESESATTSRPTETASSTETEGYSTEYVDSAKTAEAANATINDFMAAVKTDTAHMKADGIVPGETEMPEGSFDIYFGNSMSYIDTEKFTEYRVGQIIGGFAAIYLLDPNATIVSKDAESMKIDGDTATIRGSAFTITIKGTEKQGSSDSDGSLTLTFADGEWKITDCVDGTK